MTRQNFLNIYPSLLSLLFLLFLLSPSHLPTFPPSHLSLLPLLPPSSSSLFSLTPSPVSTLILPLQHTLHVHMADEAVRVGPAIATESYLNMEAIL